MAKNNGTKVESIRLFMTKRQTNLYGRTGLVPGSVEALAKKLAKAANQPVDICQENGDYIYSEWGV